MASEGLLSLASGPLQLVLAPSTGGSIARFDYVAGEEKFSILRGIDGIPESPLQAASFPLVPYCNRIRNGRFRFRGKEVTIARNLNADASPLHGDGWLAAWTVEDASEAEAKLGYRHESGEWPWTYDARQSFRLDGEGLDIRLSCTNLSDDPMPCGLGQHPYFHCTPGTLLDTSVSHAWTIDDKVLPVEKVPAIGRYDLRGRRICGQGLDNGFAGWAGAARIRMPGCPFGITLSSQDAGFFQVYSPAEGGIFVAEPVTHANAALNEPEELWPELGLRVLEPGEEMVLNARLSLVFD